MNKTCTNIKQSKKLIELGIDVNTADMFYCNGHVSVLQSSDFITVNSRMREIYPQAENYIPAWSLTRLFDIIPQELFGGQYIINITEGTNYKWIISYEPLYEISSYIDASSYNLIDCCVEMIIKLKERNLL